MFVFRAANRFVIPVFSLSFLLGLAGSGCHSSRLTEKQKGVLSVQLSAEPVSLDPALAEDGLSLEILGAMMEGLVGYDADGRLQNLLAQSYEVSPDGLRYEFTLRPGVKWSDGRPVEAGDFVFGIRRSLSPDVASKLAELLMPIRGARDFHLGKKGELPGVFERGGKLVIELEHPAPYFIQALSLSVAMPGRADILGRAGDRYPEDAPTTGPYRFAAHQPDRRILLERNPYFWGRRGGMSLIDFVIVRDESTAVNLLEEGKVDVLTRVPLMDIARLRGQRLLRVDPFLATYYLSFNTREPPFDDRDFRRAVAGVIRREQIVQALGGDAIPARGWIPRGLEGYLPYSDPRPGFADSVRLVRSRLARQGAGAPIAASFDTGSRNGLILEKIQQDLARGLGMRITLTNLDWKTYVKSLQTDPTPIFRFGWLAPFRDPIVHLQVFVSGNPNNYTGWKSAEYDRLVSGIGSMPPGPGREEKIRRAQRILVDEEAVVVPIYHYVQMHAVSPRIRGFRVNPFGVIDFSGISYVDEPSQSVSK